MKELFIAKYLSELFERYEFQYLDYALVLLLFITFFVSMKSRKWLILNIGAHNITVFIITILLLFSYARNPTALAMKTVVVTLCSFLLLIMASSVFTKAKMDFFIDALVRVTTVVFFLNLLSIFSGMGITTWGQSLTLKGLYFYKTDYATFLFHYMILMRYKIVYNKDKKFPWVLLLILATILIFLTNARVFIPLVALYYAVLYCEIKKTSIRSLFKLRNILFLGLCVYLGFVSFTQISKNFPGLNLLQIDITNFFSESNTQGRSVIWTGIYEFMTQKATFLQKLFGVDLVSSSTVNSAGIRAHSMYFYVWFSTGFVGFCAFLLLWCSMFRIMYVCKDRALSMTFFLLWIQMMIAGFTQEIVGYTQHTWIVFTVYGLALAEVKSSRFYTHYQSRHPRFLIKEKEGSAI